MRIRATAVITNTAGKLLVVWGCGDRDGNLPGGAKEAGETIEEALIREVFSEVGITAVNPVLRLETRRSGDQECRVFTVDPIPIDAPISYLDGTITAHKWVTPTPAALHAALMGDEPLRAAAALTNGTGQVLRWTLPPRRAVAA